MILSILLFQVNVDGGLIGSIKDLFLEFGAGPVLSIIIIGLILYVFYKWVIHKIVQKDKEKDKKIEELTKAMASIALDKNKNTSGLSNTLSIEKITDLSQHPFFYNIEYMLGVKMNQTVFSSASKKNLFNDFLHVRFNCSLIIWKNFLKNTPHYEMSREELNVHITKLFIDIDNCRKKEYKNLNIPSNVMMEFQKSSSLADTFLHSASETFIQTKVFKSGEDIIYSILTLCMHINEVIFNNLILSAEKFNGSLDNLNYKSKLTKDI